MPNLHSYSMLAAVFFFSIVAVEPVAAQPSEDRPADEPEEALTADQVAAMLTEATGAPRDVDKLAFTFVVEAGGEQKVSRRHVWWPKKGRLKVTHGEKTVEFENLHQHDPSKLVRSPTEHAETWQAIAPEVKPAMAARAWSWFINDSYWLLAPAKVMDPGVNRALDDRGRLVLTFGDVGLTPGDTYRLTFDRERGVVTRWDFKLQSGREGAFRWTGYEQFGPLTLSTRRVSTGGPEGDGGKTEIRFENIQVKAGQK